jgi:hypothetical protein
MVFCKDPDKYAYQTIKNAVKNSVPNLRDNPVSNWGSLAEQQ